MKIDWKKAIGLTAAVAMLVPLAACGGSDNGGSDKKASGTQNITLSVWAPQEDQAKDTNWLGKVEEIVSILRRTRKSSSGLPLKTIISAHLPFSIEPVSSPTPASSALRFVAVYIAKALLTPTYFRK